MSLHNRKSTEPYIRDDIEYRDYQVEGVRRMWNMPSFLLADDMGLGKSLQSMTVAGVHASMRKKKRDKDTKILVVCPVSLKYNWVNEVEKFTRMSYVMLEGPPKKRQKQLEEFNTLSNEFTGETKFLIVNYEQVKGHLAAINKMMFDIVIADEAHYLKNHNAIRTQAFMLIRTERSFLLTGSPMLNNPSELWSLVNRIEPGKWGTYWQFVTRYCRFGGFDNKQIMGPKNLDELTQRLNRIMIRRRKEDVLDLPSVMYVDKIVALTPLQKKLYDQVVKELVLDNGTEEVEIKSDLTKFLRLKQICGTTATVLEDGKDESAKLDLAEEDAEQICAGGHKIIVFTQFRGVLAAYKARLQKRMPNVPLFELHGDVPMNTRQDAVNAWSNTEGAAVILCMIQVAGVGLNMVAARHIQFLDEDFVPKINEQAVARANRIGQQEEHAVQVFKYYVKGTVEDRVKKILKTKTGMFDQVVESGGDSYVKAMMKEMKAQLKAEKAA